MPRGLQIKNQGGKDAEIYIYGDIFPYDWWPDTVSAAGFKDELQNLKNNGVSNLTIRINSSGGDVFEGVAIYNLLRSFPGQVNTHVDGLAASIASIIMLAGDKITIAENAMVMIHDPWSCLCGSAEELRGAADRLDKVKAALVETYVLRTKMDENTVAQKMAAETWFIGKEAVDAGLAHALSNPVKLAGAFNSIRNFKNTPKSLLDVLGAKPTYDSSPSNEGEKEEVGPETGIPKDTEPVPEEAKTEDAPNDAWRVSLLRRRLALEDF